MRLRDVEKLRDVLLILRDLDNVAAERITLERVLVAKVLGVLAFVNINENFIEVL